MALYLYFRGLIMILGEKYLQVPLWDNIMTLRMFAGYNYLFKCFFFHFFFASKIYNNTFNTKFTIG